jgi:hypothetical protein
MDDIHSLFLFSEPRAASIEAHGLAASPQGSSFYYFNILSALTFQEYTSQRPFHGSGEPGANFVHFNAQLDSIFRVPAIYRSGGYRLVRPAIVAGGPSTSSWT